MQDKELINISFQRHLLDTLKGNFYQEFNSSLNEIIILYGNRLKGRTKTLNDIEVFVGNYAKSLTENLSNHFSPIIWKRETKRTIFQWKKRILFLLENKKDIFVELLLRDDFNTLKAQDETTLKFNQWLSTLDEITIMQYWVLENNQGKPTLANIKNYGGTKSDSTFNVRFYNNSIHYSVLQEIHHNHISSNTHTHNHFYDNHYPESQCNSTNFKKDYNYFWQILSGKTDEEKKETFDFITSKLLDKYITQIDSDTYQWRNDSKGKLKYLCGLIYVLIERNYILVPRPPKELADLINYWLKHSCTTLSLEKGLQPEELKIFTDGDYKKYIEDFVVYFPRK